MFTSYTQHLEPKSNALFPLSDNRLEEEAERGGGGKEDDEEKEEEKEQVEKRRRKKIPTSLPLSFPLLHDSFADIQKVRNAYTNTVVFMLDTIGIRSFPSRVLALNNKERV